MNNKTSCGTDCTGFSFWNGDGIAHITAHRTEAFVFLYSGLLWHTTYRFCADERRLIALNTKIDYLYRDASNYKVWNSCVISGELSSSNIDEIMETLVDGENFFPILSECPKPGSTHGPKTTQTGLNCIDPVLNQQISRRRSMFRRTSWSLGLGKQRKYGRLSKKRPKTKPKNQ